ncbi:MAG TPA: hypothetical protein VF598_14080 [Hymenobacter sp.]
METIDFAAFVAYFRNLAAANKQLAGSFVHGPARRIVEGARSKLTYPLLWLETPALVLEEKDGTDPNGRRECALLILINMPANTADTVQDQAWAASEQLMLQVISRMRRDRKNRLFTFRLTSAIEPINTLTVNNEYGWRVEFEVGKPAGLCYDAAQWQEGGLSNG